MCFFLLYLLTLHMDAKFTFVKQSVYYWSCINAWGHVHFILPLCVAAEKCNLGHPVAGLLMLQGIGILLQ